MSEGFFIRTQEENMSKTLEEVKLHDGTLIRHKVVGYEGRIEGTTGIKTCFTEGGSLMAKPTSAHTFQYRVVVAGESMRRIAPAEDLEILEGMAEVVCPACRYSFRSKLGVVNKPGGRCACGGWICPVCLACQSINDPTAKSGAPVCAKQRSRQTKKLAAQKKNR
jgi:hypothetical protein